MPTVPHHSKRNRKGAKNAKVREEAEPNRSFSAPALADLRVLPAFAVSLSCFIGPRALPPEYATRPG
jgi:hypothetical protein